VLQASLIAWADSLTAVAGGILRGTGRSPIGAAINLTAYYVVGIPIGLFLTFRRGAGLIGLWGGLTLALALTGTATNIYVLTIDTKKEADVAQRRAAAEVSRAAAAARSDAMNGQLGSK
jgi:MATE family multidrug resistance protein